MVFRTEVQAGLARDIERTAWMDQHLPFELTRGMGRIAANWDRIAAQWAAQFDPQMPQIGKDFRRHQSAKSAKSADERRAV